MADTLCGPSNALQNFQKHTTLDRTLQQDRLIGRHSPVQGFRSSAGSSAGALDSEFEAFQGARPGTPKDLPSFSRQFAPPPPQQFAQAPQLPDWANDFQRLTLSAPAPQAVQHSRPGTANPASAWHQDFMRQQSTTPIPQAPALQQTTYGSMPGYGMSAFGGPSFMQAPGFQNAPVAETVQGAQRAQEAIPAFDEAAFEDAFAQAQQDMLDVAAAEQVPVQAQPEALGMDRTRETDPLLEQLRETRPAVFSAIQVWSETGLGRTGEAVSYLDNMLQLEQTGQLIQDANEAKWIVDSLQRIVARDAPQEVKTRAESLVSAINQRLMSQYPLTSRVPMSEEQIWKDLEAAGYMRSPERERFERKPEQQQEQPALSDEDEMAVTAGRLLERVADNQTEKFQNSMFFQLMRKLRDHEVRVQEDKIVQVNEQDTGLATNQTPQSSMSYPYTELQQQQQHAQQAAAPISTQIPGIDLQILNHAAMDLEMPIYSDKGHEHQTRSEPQQQEDEQDDDESVEEPSTMAEYEPYLDDLAEWDRARTEAAAAAKEAEFESKIPTQEQDEDLYRDYEDVWTAHHRVPGRDPVTKARGPPESALRVVEEAV